MSRIFIVEDHFVMLDVYVDLFSREPDLEICGQAKTVEVALAAIPACQPDLVIVDVSLSGKNGIELVTALKEQSPDIPTLMISGHDESIYAEEAIRVGARGYIMKDKFRLFTVAIRQVLDGKIYLSEEIRDRFSGSDWLNQLESNS
jgi:DNA-binding NarL/FixJ family response regulator